METKRWRKLKQNLAPKNPNIASMSSDTQILATFWERGKAQVIDTFMIYTPILYFFTYGVIGNAQGFRDSLWAPLGAVLLYGFIVALFLRFKKQTPGKKAYDLLIIRENGKPLTFSFALLRFFLFLCSGVCVIGILSPLWRADKKAWHDLILKTQVIKKEKIIEVN